MYKIMVENAGEPIICVDIHGSIISWNHAAETTFGYSSDHAVGKPLTFIIQQRFRKDCEHAMKRLKSAAESNSNGKVIEIVGLRKDGSEFPGELSLASWKAENGIFCTVIMREITAERKRLGQAEEALRETIRRLEVAYDQSIIYAQQLKEELMSRKRAEAELQENEATLKALAHNLEEMNTALKVLLRFKEKDKTDLEEKVLANVRELVIPYTEKLKKTRLSKRQTAYLRMIESSLNDIVSPLAYRLSPQYLRLTPTEIEIAHLVRDGKTTKEIAELLNLSCRTVESHRQNIRIKSGLKNTKENLRSHLLSVQNY